jgi:ATP-dependent Clp protease protease subunit
MISSSNQGANVKKIDEFNADDRIGIRLLENHVYHLYGEIDIENVNGCIRWITYENLDVREERVLTIYINSTGGDLYQALALIDIIKNSLHPVRIIGVGAVMSAAFLIFAAGTKGQRYAATNTSFMCHQFTSGGEAKYHDIKAEMKENESLNAKMVEILKDATGLSSARIRSKLLPASDVYLTAQETVDIGVADHIL